MAWLVGMLIITVLAAICLFGFVAAIMIKDMGK